LLRLRRIPPGTVALVLPKLAIAPLLDIAPADLRHVSSSVSKARPQLADSRRRRDLFAPIPHFLPRGSYVSVKCSYPEIIRLDEVHTAPQIKQRFSSGVPVSASRCSDFNWLHRLGHLRARVLDESRLIQDRTRNANFCNASKSRLRKA